MSFAQVSGERARERERDLNLEQAPRTAQAQAQGGVDDKKVFVPTHVKQS
jgi:hypothetical protein